jgi:hypothetical protein
MAATPNQALLDFRMEEGRIMKTVARILEQNFVNATLIVTELGIFVQENNGDKEMNIPCTIILEVFLKRQFFNYWLMPRIEPSAENQAPGEICLGISTSDLKKALHQVNKTDSLRVYVLASDHSKLYFDITKSSGGMSSTKWVTLVDNPIGRIVPPTYKDHRPTVVVSAQDYKRITTDANLNSKQKVKFSAQENGILIEGTSSSIRGLRHCIGEWDDSKDIIYSAKLSTQRLHSFSQVSVNNIAKTIQIYVCNNGNPVKLSCQALSLGTISMYIQEEGDQDDEQAPFSI